MPALAFSEVTMNRPALLVLGAVNRTTVPDVTVEYDYRSRRSDQVIFLGMRRFHIFQYITRKPGAVSPWYQPGATILIGKII